MQNKHNKTIDYLGDSVAIKVLNKGKSAEYISIKAFFPDHVEVLGIDSKITGRRTRISKKPSLKML